MIVPVMIAFGVLISATTALELVGVFSKRSGDTITEGWTWISDHLPAPAKWAFRVGTLGFFLWCILHFWGQP